MFHQHWELIVSDYNFTKKLKQLSVCRTVSFFSQDVNCLFILVSWLKRPGFFMSSGINFEERHACIRGISSQIGIDDEQGNHSVAMTLRAYRVSYYWWLPSFLGRFFILAAMRKTSITYRLTTVRSYHSTKIGGLQLTPPAYSSHHSLWELSFKWEGLDQGYARCEDPHQTAIPCIIWLV